MAFYIMLYDYNVVQSAQTVEILVLTVVSYKLRGLLLLIGSRPLTVNFPGWGEFSFSGTVLSFTCFVCVNDVVRLRVEPWREGKYLF